MDEDDPGAGYALFTNEGAINNTSPHGALRAYDFAGYTLQVRCVRAAGMVYLQYERCVDA